MTEKQKQHARRFLDASIFKTYDAILALVKHVEKDRKKKGAWKAGEPLIFTGSTERLAAKNGTCDYTESRHIKRLVEDGWLIQIAGQRRSDGSFGTKHYRVLLVEEWQTTHPDFVQKKYGKQRNLRKTNTRRHLKRIGVPVEPGVDAVVVLGDPLIPYTGTQPSPTTGTQPSVPTGTQPSQAAGTQPSPTTGTQTCVWKSVVDSKPVDSSPHTHAQSASENLESNTFTHVAKYLELDMLTSQWKRGEMDKAEALIREHGWKKFYAVQRLYWQEQDPEQFSKTLFRWTGLLNSFSGLLAKVTAEMLQEQDTDRFRKEHPEEWERIQKESMDRQTVILVRERFTNNTPKEPIAECTTPLEDFLNKD